VHTHGKEYGDPRGAPLLVNCYWAWFLKKHCSQFWATYIQKYGDPPLVGYTKNMFTKAPGSTLGWGELMASFIKNLRSGNSAVFPLENESKIEAITPGGGTATGNDVFDNFMRFLSAQMTLVLLGQLLTTSTTGVGSYALGDVLIEYVMILLKLID